MVGEQKVYLIYFIVLASVATILLLIGTAGAAIFAYIPNAAGYTVSVINTTTDTVTATVPVGTDSEGVAVTP